MLQWRIQKTSIEENVRTGSYISNAYKQYHEYTLPSCKRSEKTRSWDIVVGCKRFMLSIFKSKKELYVVRIEAWAAASNLWWVMWVAPDGAFVRRLAAVAANLFIIRSHKHEKNAVLGMQLVVVGPLWSSRLWNGIDHLGRFINLAHKNEITIKGSVFNKQFY
jgi:hypothetical protein